MDQYFKFSCFVSRPSVCCYLECTSKVLFFFMFKEDLPLFSGIWIEDVINYFLLYCSLFILISLIDRHQIFFIILHRGKGLGTNKCSQIFSTAHFSSLLLLVVTESQKSQSHQTIYRGRRNIL